MVERPHPLTSGPLRYAPENELGVVFLFAYLAPRIGLRVEMIQSRFPDCLAYRRTGKGERSLRIEFEYRSSNFRAHRHDPSRCDVIACWQHDWPDVPKHLEVIELRNYFKLGPKVWIQPVIRSQWPNLESRSTSWGVSAQAGPGDLLLMYRCYPQTAITDLYVLVGPLSRGQDGWRSGSAYFGAIRRVCHLASPVFLADLRRHRVLSSASFVRRNMQGNLHASEYWPYLYELIVSRNSRVHTALARFQPEKL